MHRGEAELVKSTIRDRGRHRVIDKVSVVLNDKKDIHTAAFSNLGLKAVPIDDRTGAKPAEETVVVHVCPAQETERDDRKKAQLIGLSDIIRQTGIAARVTKEAFLFYGVACLLYLVLALLSSIAFGMIERRVGQPERAH